MNTTVPTKPISHQELEKVARANTTTASISERENREIKAANASGHTPVVFIHSLWLLPGSWASRACRQR